MRNNNEYQKRFALFLDAATPLFYIAVKDFKKEIIVEKSYNHDELKGEALSSVVKKIFDENHYDVHELAFLCTTKGPGSLTGLRIVMSLIKTMGQILKVPIVCIPTLYALERSFASNECIENKKIITCLLARKNSYYVRFSGNEEDTFKQISTETLCEKAKDVNILLWPSGSVIVDDCDKQRMNSVIVKLSTEVIFNVSKLKYEEKKYVDYIECQPEYAGKSVAEKNFENK
ncbi:MAG: tRNA (adenosine(37)-N6)-threonylcarbamoyltransferase complex dimerization subunit type 1 TsaB [Thermotogota bacterium]|nr:tRNA (adenosine(37)-N6)-threonylcarbamoyltransferase complex dimerization subunit type 1 TsaB [Thermotogota bacterium]